MNGTAYQHQIDEFITNGFLKIENAFPQDLARQCQEILWRDTGCDRDDRTTWTKPVVWLGNYSQPPFIEAANTAILHQYYNMLAGKGNWAPPAAIGSFPVRFPATSDTGDTGWHIDVSFPDPYADTTNFFTWRANINSKGRCLLMLFLFSDIGNHDAPTKIRVGSHLDMAARLAPEGEKGLNLQELAANNFTESSAREIVLATGKAGTVYLCHPFLVHAATINHGLSPRFLAQPPLHPVKDYHLNRDDHFYNPVEIAIRRGLGLIAV